MYTKKERTKRLLVDILLMLIGFVITVAILYFVQTSFSLRRQAENSQIKFDIAAQRMESHKQEAQEYLDRYDDFSQAKADAISYFYSENPNQVSEISSMAEQWGLKELYILNGNKEIINSNVATVPDFNDVNSFEPLFTSGQTVMVGDIRYYLSKINDEQMLVAGRESKECMIYVDGLTSYATSFSTIKVGTTGRIIVINKNDNTILYDSKEGSTGKTLQEAGFNRASFKEGYEGWVVFQNTSYYSESKMLNDDVLMLSMVPRSEILKVDITMVSITAGVFAIILFILVIYRHLIRFEAEENGAVEVKYRLIFGKWYFNCTIWKKMSRVLMIGTVAIFVLSFYIQTLGGLSAQTARSDSKQTDIEDIYAENKKKAEGIVEAYNEEYLGRAENIAYLLMLDPGMVDDDRLATLAEKAQIKKIYVFDENGAVNATNSSYKNYKLSTDEEDRAYEFWDVIHGYRDSVIQEVAKENGSGEYLQFVGCKRKDADGMVQLGISPQRLENRLKQEKPEVILENIAVENHGYLIGADKETGKIIYSNDKTEVTKKISTIGLKKQTLEDGYSGYQTVNNQNCFVTSNVIEDTVICMIVPVAALESSRVAMTLTVTLLSLLFILIIIGRSLITDIDKIENKQDDPENNDESENHVLVEITTTVSGEEHRVQSASSRWGSGKKEIPWSECNADERLIKILKWIIRGIALLLVIYLVIQRDKYDKDSILSYIIHRKWEKIPNIFSMTYIGFVMTEVIVISSIIRKVIVTISRSFGARAETVGRLLDSFIAYISIIGAMFYSLQFIGVNSSTLLASAGLLSIIVGLGAQSLISDILAGIFIVFEGEFRVGDIITVDTWRGTVLEIGIRSTKIEDISGNIKILNNSKISGVVNMTKKYSFASCDVGIEYDEQIEHVESVLSRELPKIQERLPAIKNGPFYKGVVELADSSVVIRIVAECQEVDRIQLCRDLNREVKILCDHNDISIAYPQIVVHDPVKHQKATKREVKSSEEFVKKHKAESEHIVISD